MEIPVIKVVDSAGDIKYQEETLDKRVNHAVKYVEEYYNELHEEYTISYTSDYIVDVYDVNFYINQAIVETLFKQAATTLEGLVTAYNGGFTMQTKEHILIKWYAEAYLIESILNTLKVELLPKLEEIIQK